MLLDYNRDKLRRALSDFSNTTGLNIDFADCNFSQLMLHKLNHCSYCSAIFNTPDGNSGCIHSDMELFLKCRESGKPEKRVCHAGLLDVAIPIFHGSLLLGYIIFGQMRTEPDFSKLAKSIEHLNLDFEKMKEYYNELPIYNDEKIQSIVNVAVMLTSKISLLIVYITTQPRSNKQKLHKSPI